MKESSREVTVWPLVELTAEQILSWVSFLLSVSFASGFVIINFATPLLILTNSDCQERSFCNDGERRIMAWVRGVDSDVSFFCSRVSFLLVFPSS